MGCGASTVSNSLSNHPHSNTKEAAKPSSLPSSSNLNQKLEESNSIPKRGQRIDTNEIIENFLLIWLDAKIDETKEDYQNSIKHLRRTVNTIETFQDIEECIDYTSKLQDKKAFVIISGALCQTVVPRIHNINQIHSIYIFCRKQEKYEEWTKGWSKIKGIYTEITLICDSARKSARQCDEDSIVISAVSSLNQIEPTFMYTQLFKEIILEIDFDENKEIQNLADYARKKYPDNDEIINEFAEAYPYDLDKNNKPVWWYTRECFTYHMLNKALGTLQVETLLKMGVFIRDLHQNIKKIHLEQINDIDTVYRGKTMPKKEFDSKIKQDGLMSFNNFLSTSIDRHVALHFIEEGLKSNKDKTGVLFEMTIDQSNSLTPFARIKEFSYFKKENEILFSMHTVFRVQQIKEIHENMMTIWQVKLTLTSDSDDQQLNTLTQLMRQEITGTGWQRMGSLLLTMGENDKAEKVYTMLLEQASDDSNKSYCYNQLGMIKDAQGEYNMALEFYTKSLDINEKTLPPNHPNLARSYNNIGSVYDTMGEYSKALSYYEKDLEISLKAFPPNHPSLATSYNNIGFVYNNMGEYAKALSSYERSLEILKIVLPPNHPNLGGSYSNIGEVYRKMGEYSKALSSYERSLEIQKIALPPNHPSLATSYNNIAAVYDNMGEYSKALSSYERSLEIRKIALPPNHPDLASSYNNIGSVYDNMGEYSKALSSYERSLEIKEIALPSNHPDLAGSYNNIGEVYRKMGEYSKALSSYERSLEIQKIALPSNHPNLATSYNNIGAVYDDMGEYSKALSSYERSLEIRKIALPPNHPDLASSYNNIGSVYNNMGEYSKALSYSKKAQEIFQKSLPSNHPYIALVKSNIEEVEKKM
ncbi:unnamed protein product [Rotaria sordida]|uniref:NAD(P)(+)--arginine ADP-ribosyltransferase n=1 Tax=Rotaria sordida TaxID=392033 RepID=A0A815K905_9BILA|nr:unnamed protein product [Rotaria sordida]CAF3993744.1 unnamed protein product [Rotaria sordida]